MRLLLFLFVIGSLWAEAVVIASEGENIKARVSEKASRCNYYIIVSSEGLVLKNMTNPHQNASGGASSHLMKLLHTEKASHFIAARIGMKLEDAFIADKIDYTIFNGSVEDAIRSYIKGTSNK